MTRFPTADNNHSFAINNQIVLSETHAIELSIQSRVALGFFNATVTGTTFTDETASDTETVSMTYWRTWQGEIEDLQKTEQMNMIIAYFQRLGYSISRFNNPNTLDTNTHAFPVFQWVLAW